MKVAEFVILFIAIPGFIGAQSHDYSIRAERLNEQVAELNKISDSIFNIKTYRNLASLYVLEGDYNKADFYFNNLMAVSKKTINNKNVPHIFCMIIGLACPAGAILILPFMTNERKVVWFCG